MKVLNKEVTVNVSVYQCDFCEYESRYQNEVLNHIRKIHTIVDCTKEDHTMINYESRMSTGFDNADCELIVRSTCKCEQMNISYTVDLHDNKFEDFDKKLFLFIEEVYKDHRDNKKMGS